MTDLEIYSFMNQNCIKALDAVLVNSLKTDSYKFRCELLQALSHKALEVCSLFKKLLA